MPICCTENGSRAVSRTAADFTSKGKLCVEWPRHIQNLDLMTTTLNHEDLLKDITLQAERLALLAEIPAKGEPCARDVEVRKILGRSSELVRGAAALGRDQNIVTLNIVLRTLVENLIVMLWIEVSEENAERQSKAAQDEIKKLLRVNLAAGEMKATNEATGEDSTAEVLASGLLTGPASKNLDQAAREAGVSSLYNVVYRPLSLTVHAHGLDMDDEEDGSPLEAALEAVASFGGVLEHAGRNWLTNRQRTENKTLRELLGFVVR